MRRLSRLVFGAVLTAAVAAPARAAEIDPLLPAETEGVVFVNVRQILDSELIKKYALGQIKQALEGNDAQKAIKELGLDPLKDVDRVSVGLWGKQEDMNGVFVIRGKFEPAKLFDAAEKASKNKGDQIEIVSEGKYKLVKVTPKEGGPGNQKPVYLSVADEKTVIAATDPKLAVKTVETAEKGAKPALKKDLAALVLKQDEKASVFVCGLVDGKVSELPPGFNIPNIDAKELQQQLATLQSVALTIRLTDDVGLEVAAGMKDAESATAFGATATKLVETAKVFLPFAGAQQPQAKPVIDDLVNTLKSSVKESSVVISLKLSSDAIAKAAEGAKQ